MARITPTLLVKSGWTHCHACHRLVEYGDHACRCGRPGRAVSIERRPRYDLEGNRLPDIRPSVAERAERIVAAEAERLAAKTHIIFVQHPTRGGGFHITSDQA